MFVAVDFDGVVVDMHAHPYEDTKSKPALMPYAKEGLISLKKAGHVLLLYSARANLSLRKDPNLDPLVQAGIRKPPRDLKKSQELSEARYQQMLDFVNEELPGIFDAIDDGMQGKPNVDLVIDDRALRYGSGVLSANWRVISNMYGEPVYGADDGKQKGK